MARQRASLRECLLQQAGWVREETGGFVEWEQKRASCQRGRKVCWWATAAGGRSLTSWLGILLMREAGGVPVRRIICCSWFISKASESRGRIAQRSQSQKRRGSQVKFILGWNEADYKKWDGWGWSKNTATEMLQRKGMNGQRFCCFRSNWQLRGSHRESTTAAQSWGSANTEW